MLIVESRAVREDYYAEHADRMRAIETSKNDLTAIMQVAQSAYEDGRPVSASTELAFSRLTENNALLQRADERLRGNTTVDTHLSTYDTELSGFVRDGQAFTARQNAFADALRTLQEESPDVVKDLRRDNLRLESQNAFSLAIEVIEFATGGGSGDGRQLKQRIEQLGSSTAARTQAPGTLDAFINAANAVIEQKAAAGLALQKISSSRIVEHLWALSDEILNDNRRTVSRAERAGLLLAVCTVLLLIGAGYAMFRLQTSYRELNRSNRELESINNSLEERVTDRTQELSAAYDDLKESQVQLVQAEKMSSLGELVAGISHEINTPLWYLISNSTVLQERMEQVGEFCDIAEDMIAGVKSQTGVKEAISRGLMGMQRMLKDGMKDDIDEAKDLIQDSIEGLEELTELAQSLKDFSRLDRARYGEFNVNDGLDKTLLIAKNKLKDKVSVHKHYGDLPTIHCSPSQINQIFLNLLTNAADAIEESGDIVIRTIAEEGKVRISFADTGSGISPDAMSKIRDPFFTTKDVGKGTGLGLSIVDQIVTSHGGELLIESELDKGTTVTIVLPVAAAMPAAEADEAEAVEKVSEEAAANDPDSDAESSLEMIDNDDGRDDVPEVATV
ncbi:MAG: ATP-binding protein [Gammaproteobacteria bacterium]|nr:ATP-binding protein [Gammaproteobacteria bacterium]MDH3431498.1 ATP-binding protein [Gammaproteobacteria bacterium]